MVQTRSKQKHKKTLSARELRLCATDTLLFAYVVFRPSESCGLNRHSPQTIPETTWLTVPTASSMPTAVIPQEGGAGRPSTASR